MIQRILEVCPIAAVQGTPTHDLTGCYAALQALKGANPFYMMQPDNPRFLGGMLVLGCPEPSREWLLAGKEGANAEETANLLRDGMRSILLGLGAIRANHPELPCVMLYHGVVEGASIQNGQVIGAGEITIGREDLALVGADYYALGHIHLAQQIPGLNAYYSGSAYPVSWGELGQNGFNLVEFGEGRHEGKLLTLVKCIPFPHPRRVKFSLPWPEPAGDVAGVQAWICYKATKENAAKIDTAALLEAYMEQGALPGSRVTVELIPTETVRAPEITEKHRLREKILVYAEASASEKTSFIPDLHTSVLDKADQLEREAEERGTTAGMHVRIRRLRLRGAVGIWKGLRQDEIDIDLDRYSPGLIALVGVNGSGKSTLIENMHPYTCMLTRDGKLQDHFRLRDSMRELWFTDERTGAEYRALMEIDGANTSGSVKYHLFRDGEPLTNGRKEDYEQAIERMVGSLPLFLRSAFVSQRATKSNPDLSDATKGEKKAIFRELAGLDYIQAYSESAKARAGQLESQVTTGRAQAEILERIVTEEPIVHLEIEHEQLRVFALDRNIEEIQIDGKQLREKVDALAALVTEQNTLGRDIDSAANDAQMKLGQIETARTKIENFQSALNLREVTQENVDYHAHLKEQEGAENERLSKVNAERSRISAEYGNALKTHAADVKGFEIQRTRLRTEKARMEGDHKVLLSQSERLKGEIEKPLTDECPLCGAEKEHQKKDLNAGREEKQTQFRNLAEKIHTLGNQIMVKEGEILAIKDPSAPIDPPLPPADETELKRIRAALAEIDIAKNRTSLETAAKAEQEITTLQAQITTLEVDAAALSEKAEQLRARLDPEIRTAHDQAAHSYEEARAAYTAAKEERATAAAKLEAAQKQLAAIEKQKCELDELKGSLAKIEAEAAEWRYLETACGPDGIQALELDAMGPGISEVANRLLSAAYGSRFSIEFRTTRIAGKGSKTKQVEDFAIYVLDNELLTEQPIENTIRRGKRVDQAGVVFSICDHQRSHNRSAVSHGIC